MSPPIEIRDLGFGDLGLIGEIDRSEYQDIQYRVEAGRLLSRPMDFEVPTWSREGSGEHSVNGVIEYRRPTVARGATFFGASDQDDLLGLAIVDGAFEPGLAWLAFLYVSRPHRRRGVASALWSASAEIGRDSAATSIYVSATPSGSAVGFYRSRGCVLAEPPHPELLAEEPDNIHLVCPLD